MKTGTSTMLSMADNEDQDKMLYNAAFQQSLYCLQKNMETLVWNKHTVYEETGLKTTLFPLDQLNQKS